MNTEIEMKAWVDNPDLIQEKILALPARKIREYNKTDIYFHLLENGRIKQELRLRSDADSAIVTLKEKMLDKSLEVNFEREFTVSDPEHFMYMLEGAGYLELIRKSKRGTSWQYRNYSIELSEIPGLGHFLELELLVEGQVPGDNIHQIKEEAKEEFHKLFTQLGIGAEKIEHRRYTSMLIAKILG
ncbi:MAG: class IV adenylate cyclase [Salinispira sp.]